MDILTDLWNDIVQGLLDQLNYFNDPEKRINYIYLISSALLAYYVYHKGKAKISFFKYLFNKKVWLSKSAFIDYKYFFFNGIIKIALIAPLLESWRYIGISVNDWLEESFSMSPILFSQTEVLIYYAIALLILSDLMTYILHLAMHKIPFLWEFHKIHHSAKTLNPITQYRVHPVELLINNIGSVLVSGFLIGLLDYFYAGSVGLVTYLEVSIFVILFNFWGANLRHSHVKLKYFHALERFLISPFQHQLHHSDNPKHFDKNMGSKLALWDWLGGTLIRSAEATKIRFGLGYEDTKNYNSFFKTLYMPFKNIGRSFLRVFKKNS